jgi:hypothetical protein
MLVKLRVKKEPKTIPRLSSLVKVNKQFSIIFSHIPNGDDYEMLDQRKVKVLKPEKAYMLGTDPNSDIIIPFGNRGLGFQRGTHGEVSVGMDGRVRYRDLSDIGSAIIRFERPLSLKALERINAVPAIKSIEHVANGAEEEIGPDAIVVVGVHEGTVANKNLYIIGIKNSAGEDCVGIRDEYEWGHVRPAFMMLVS